MSKLTIYTDGGARGNPGPAAIGVVIFDAAGKKIKSLGKYIGTATNNEAEYQALIAGLGLALELNADELECFLDSELVVKQLTGQYKVREERLKQLVMDVLRLKNKFKKISFHHLLREKNKLADKLVNDALDKEGF
jgi:ribonuclease HI